MSRAILLAATLAAGCSRPAPPADAPAAEPPAGPAWFADATDRLGVRFTHDPGPTGQYFMPQSMAAGCAVFDADGDGRMDLLLLQTAGPGSGKTNALYLQNPDGTFRDASAGSGLDFDGHNVGVAVGDGDNDGRPDVLITRYTGARLFRNEGGGRFRDVTAASGVNNPLWGASASFFDYDRDGKLDLVVVNYIDYDASWPCSAPDGTRDYCGPRTFPGTAARLFHNTGVRDGVPTFADVTVPAGLGAKAGPGLGVYCADLTGDGWPDVFVANDGKPNFLWVNQRDGTFKEEALSRGLAFTGMGHAYANMGIAAGDLDGDGLLDLFVTHLGSETNTLWRQGPAGQFKDGTTTADVTRTRWRGTGFGTLAADFDLDGRLDLAVVNGRVYRGPPADAPHLPDFWRPYGERNQLLRNAGDGKFEDVSADSPAFCGRPNVARGLAGGDLDGDGRPDLLVLATADRARVYTNVTTGGHWLGVRAVDPALGGRDLYGTELRLTAGGKTLLRVVQPADSYLSSSSPEALFGLGAGDKYDGIEARWPDGTRETFPGGPADRRLVLAKAKGRP